MGVSEHAMLASMYSFSGFFFFFLSSLDSGPKSRTDRGTNVSVSGTKQKWSSNTWSLKWDHNYELHIAPFIIEEEI